AVLGDQVPDVPGLPGGEGPVAHSAGDVRVGVDVVLVDAERLGGFDRAGHLADFRRHRVRVGAGELGQRAHVAGGGGVQPEQRGLVAGGDLLQRLQVFPRAVEAIGGGQLGQLPVGAVEVVVGGGAVVRHPRR